MPRNKRAARERAPHPGEPRVFGAEAPEWAELSGYEVRTSFGTKGYRCPGCDHEVRAGVQHLVVVPRGSVEERRHWHTECWRRELRRLGQ
jgi:hypothetical protein